MQLPQRDDIPERSAQDVTADHPYVRSECSPPSVECSTLQVEPRETLGDLLVGVQYIVMALNNLSNFD